MCTGELHFIRTDRTFVKTELTTRNREELTTVTNLYGKRTEIGGYPAI